MHLPTSNDRKPLKRLLKRKFGRIPTWNKNKGPTPPNSRSQRKCWRIANPDSISCRIANPTQRRILFRASPRDAFSFSTTYPTHQTCVLMCGVKAPSVGMSRWDMSCLGRVTKYSDEMYLKKCRRHAPTDPRSVL